MISTPTDAALTSSSISLSSSSPSRSFFRIPQRPRNTRTRRVRAYARVYAGARAKMVVSQQSLFGNEEHALRKQVLQMAATHK